MKQKFCRGMSIFLALLIITPLVGIPVFAVEPLFAQNFESGVLTDFIKTQNPSVSIQNLGEDDTHGNVFYFDMTEGPTDDGNLYLIKDQNSARYQVTEYTVNGDGTVNGKVVIALFGADPIELMFNNAVLETQKLHKDSSGNLVNAVQLYTIKLVETGEVDPDTLEPTVMEEPDQPWDQFVGALVTAKLANAWQGGRGNIATLSQLKHSELVASGSVVTYSMDYYVNHDWNVTGECKVMKQGYWGLVTFSKEGNNLVISPHDNSSYVEGGQVLIATDRWFNLSVVADYATATVWVYVNGNYGFTAQSRSYVDQIQATVVDGKVSLEQDSLHLIQANRMSGEVDLYDGYIMIDNVAIYDGEVISATAKIPAYTFSANFNGSFSAISFGTGAAVTTFTDHAMKIDLDTYDETTGEDLEAVKAIDQKLFIRKIPAFEPAEGVEDYYFEADYFIPKGAVFKIQSQLLSVTADQGSFTWVSIYTIKANGSNVVFECQGEGAATNNTEVYYTELPMGEWFTMTHRINPVSGMIYHYVNGVEYSHWQLCRGGTDLTNVSIGAGTKGWVIAKPNKINSNATSSTTGLTSYFAGHGGENYPNGYSGYIMIDNLNVYTDSEFFSEKTAETVIQDALVGVVMTDDLASIRLNSPTGLRFATKVDTAAVAQLEALGVTVNHYGTLIAPTDFMETLGELTLETYTPGENIINVEVSPGAFYELDGDENTTHFVGSIVDLIVNDTVNNITRSFSARGYINVTFANGMTANIYSSFTKSVNIKEVATATLVKYPDLYEEGSAYHAVLESYAAGILPTFEE